MADGVGLLQGLIRPKAITALFIGARKARRRAAGEEGSKEVPAPIPQLSRIANSVVFRCSRTLFLSAEELQQQFENEMPDNVTESSCYARNLLEYCSYKTLQAATKQPHCLGNKEFRRLTYDMMLAWETPGVEDESTPKENACSSNLEMEDEDGGSFFYINSTSMAAQVDCKQTVGRDAFVRIALACPAIADIITVHNLFDALTNSSAGQLHFLFYDKYIARLDKLIKPSKQVSALPLTSNIQLAEGEVLLDVDGVVPTQPVLQHIGISARPGRLTLTSHALYFEPLAVGYDKAIVYDLVEDLKQVVKPELIGPLGARLFDKAVMYKTNVMEEPVYFEFPELKGHSRRDHWLSMIQEILHVHKFIRNFDLKGIQQVEALSKAVLGIFQHRAVKEVFHIISTQSKTLLPFSLSEKLPMGDKILEALHDHLGSLRIEPQENPVLDALPDRNHQIGLPVSVLTLSRKGFSLLKKGDEIKETESLRDDFYVGRQSPLELAVNQSLCYSGQAETARETVEQVKVEGIDTNIAVMQELLFPVIESHKRIHFLATWEDPFKSTIFLILILFLMHRGWIKYILPGTFISLAFLMLWHRHDRKCNPLETFRITTPPSKNPVEQLLILQEAISQMETLIQAANIILLKLRAILLAAVPETTRSVAFALIAIGALFVVVPVKYLVFLVFLDAYTREMPLRKHSSEKLHRRMREWWVRIPAAPVKLVKSDNNKKKK